jgi:hypothetical protein
VASAVSIVEFGAIFLVGELKVATAVFAGVFENYECSWWCFCGQVVVKCVAKCGERNGGFSRLKNETGFSIFSCGIRVYDARLKATAESEVSLSHRPYDLRAFRLTHQYFRLALQCSAQ